MPKAEITCTPYRDGREGSVSREPDLIVAERSPAPRLRPTWLAPTRVRIEGDVIACAFDQIWELRESTPRVLEDFIRLANAPKERLHQFTLRWGLLVLCADHELPVTHAPFERPLSVDLPPSAPTIERSNDYKLPLDRLRAYASALGAVLRVASAPRDNCAVQAEDVAAIAAVVPSGPSRSAPEEGRQLSAHHDTLARALTTFLRWGGVETIVSWADSSPDVVLVVGDQRQGGFFGALAIELLAAVSRVDGPLLCAACGHPYLPTRRPDARRAHYCRECGRAAALRAASNKYRQRRRLTAALVG